MASLRSLFLGTLELCYCQSEITDEELLTEVKKSPHLGTLKIERCAKISLAGLKSILRDPCIGGVKILSLAGMRLTDETLLPVSSLKQLQILDIRDNPELTAKGVAAVLKQLKLKQLAIQECGIDPLLIRQYWQGPYFDLGVSYGACAKVETMRWKDEPSRFCVDFSYSEMGDTQFIEMAPLLRDATQLILYRCDRMKTRVTGSFEGFKNLTTLFVGGCLFLDEAALVLILQKLPQLQKLVLRHIQLSNSLLKQISQMTCLADLDLSFCRLPENANLALEEMRALRSFTFLSCRESRDESLPLEIVEKSLPSLVRLAQRYFKDLPAVPDQPIALRFEAAKMPFFEKMIRDLMGECRVLLAKNKLSLKEESALYSYVKVFCCLQEEWKKREDFSFPFTFLEWVELLSQPSLWNSLDVLSLAQLDLTFIPFFICEPHFGNLRVLDLSGNCLEGGLMLKWKNFPSLAHCMARESYIQVFPMTFFTESIGVKNLDLAGNMITVLTGFQGEKNSTLEQIDLSSNPIGEIDDSFWDQLRCCPSLKLVNLSCTGWTIEMVPEDLRGLVEISRSSYVGKHSS